MTIFHGKDAKITFDGVDITADCVSIDYGFDANIGDTDIQEEATPINELVFTATFEFKYNPYWSIYYGHPMVSEWFGAS